MATAKELFQVLSSFYKNHVGGPDQVFIEALWEGYLLDVSEAYRLLYQYDQSKAIAGIASTVTREWFHLDLTYLNATGDAYTYKIDEEIVSIPSLQDGITEPEAGGSRVLTKLEDTTDYVVNSSEHTITFVSDAGRDWISRNISLLDSLGLATVAGGYIEDGGLDDLVEGTDYDWGNDEHTLLILHSKVAFDAFAALNDGIAQKELETRILFAPTLQTDERLVYQNFGFLLGVLPQDIAVDVHTYTRIVKGLWYIAWSGPTPFNLSIGISVLFGYPVAPAAGLVHNVDTSEDDAVVTISTAAGDLFEVTVPEGFEVTVTKGDAVIENQPLSDAVEILDETTSPGWWTSLSLSRYAVGHQVPAGLTGEEQTALKRSLANAVFGIRLKDFNNLDDVGLRSQIMHVASRFLNRLKPQYSQFAFVADILFEEGDEADTVEVDDPSFTVQIVKRMNPTIPDNAVNELNYDGHVVTPYLDADDYNENSNRGAWPDDPAYYLGADAPFVTDYLRFEVKYSGSGDEFVDEEDVDWIAYNEAHLVDTRAPELTLSPEPGRYFYEISVRVRPDEPCAMLYTLDGRTPVFSDPPVGSPVRDRIQIPEGTWTLQVAAKDLSGNVSNVLSATYEVVLGMPPVVVNPSSVIPARFSVAALFQHTDPSMDVFYTTDGTAPTDFAFRDVLRLGGHRLVWDSPTSIRLEDPNRPVYFLRGTATINIDGPRTYEISPRRNSRYFVYALRVGDNRWRLSISLENIRFEANTPAKLLLGYVISDRSGLFTETSVINAVDAGDYQKLTKDDELTDEILNLGEDVPLVNDKAQRILRFFGKTSSGLFDPPQTHVYRFDTVAPRSTLVSSFSNQPYRKTLKVDFQHEAGSQVFWSVLTRAPQPVLFGLADRLFNGNDGLALSYSNLNILVPNFPIFDLTFRRFLSTGEMEDVETSEDVRAGVGVAIPFAPLAFFDVVVVPDLAHAGKWRLDVGPANTALEESSGAYLVARVTTDINGVVNPGAGSGAILNATQPVSSSSLAAKSKKYVGEPLTFDVSTIPYKVVIAYFAVDAAGNFEETRVKVFSS